MYFDIHTFLPVWLVLAFWCLVVPFLSKESNRSRTVIAGFTIMIGALYLFWRLFYTVLPFDKNGVALVWIWIVYLFEVLAFCEVVIFLLIMSRLNGRSGEADRYESEFAGITPPVDVFLPTYNEGLDVLEKSILGAKHMDYPDFKVWVLDDGKRPWLESFCKENNVGYLTRPDHLHAKAGNLNNGLRHTAGEFFAVFDADFVPARNFLKRTIGFFLADETIGLVQTPQHFFNKDPIQLNWKLDRLLPDEQRLFFDSMAPCRDGWGAAFCCGSCSIVRRAAIEKIGGVPTSSITEDLLTTLSLLTVGYKTVYLNETLSRGMSSESLHGYFVQRGRWCRGGIQCFFVPEGPLRAHGLTLGQRVLFSPYSWIIQPLIRFMMLLVPLMYLWFNLMPLYIFEGYRLIGFQFALLLIYFLAMRWLTGRKYVPLLASAINLFGMFRLLPVMLASLVKPFGVPFRVTPKGQGDKIGIDWYVFSSAGIFLGLTLAGLWFNIHVELRRIDRMDFFEYILFWSCINILLLFLAMLLCFDAPRKRREERFTVSENATVIGVGEVFLADMSLNGCKLKIDQDSSVMPIGATCRLLCSGVKEELSCQVVRSQGCFRMVTFTALDASQREALIVKLFTGNYTNEVGEVGGFSSVFKAMWSRAFGKEERG